MDTLPPIPTPVAQRWREFRIRVLPLFFFVIVALAVTFLWREVAVPPTLAVGFVETNGATVSVPIGGLLAELNVKRFQQVKAGDQICKLIIKDPKVLEAELAVIKADIDMIKIAMTPIVDEERARLAYYQLKLNVMQERGIYATESIQLRQAKEEFRGALQMLKDNAISTNAFEQVKTRMDTLQASVEQREKLLLNGEEDLKKFTFSESGPTNAQTPIAAAIGVEAAKIKQIEAASNPILLLAPIDGMVMNISRHTGENLRVGETVLTISSTQSEQIIGYVRQPMSVQPKVGMAVQVRARTPKRLTAPATVVQVGAQMEAFSAAMIPNAANQRQSEWGLPIQVSLPPALKLVPGELVDLIFDK
jgi:multidrug resistance efflux pump